MINSEIRAIHSVEQLEQIRRERRFGVIIGTSDIGYKAKIINWEAITNSADVFALHLDTHWTFCEAFTFDELIDKVFEATR